MDDEKFKILKDILDGQDEKLDSLSEKLHSMEIIQVEQGKDLKYHIKRTDLLEKKLEPVEEHVSFLRMLIKLIGALSVIAGLVQIFLTFF